MHDPIRTDDLYELLNKYFVMPEHCTFFSIEAKVGSIATIDSTCNLQWRREEPEKPKQPVISYEQTVSDIKRSLEECTLLRKKINGNRS